MLTVKYTTDKEMPKGTTMACSTADVSERGMRVHLKKALEPGTIVSTWVKRTDQPGTLTLNGIVKWWKKRTDTTGYWVGIQIDPSSTDDIKLWKLVVASL